MTPTQQKVYDALCAVACFDFDNHKAVFHRVRRVAVAAALPYDTVRRALAKLHEAGAVVKVSPEDEFIGRELWYAPNWTHDRENAPSGWMSEWDERMSKGCRFYSPGAEFRLYEDDRRLREKYHKW